jgi:hypothetical protein
MMKHLIMSAAVVALLTTTTILAADAPKSGPQKGEKLPGPFEPLNINGESAGQKNCLYCQYGQAPVAMVFARTVTPELKTLIAKLDACNEANKSTEMGTCVIFCSADKKLEQQLANLAKEAKLKNTILSIEAPEGPEKYNIAKEADVTVLVYKERVVSKNLTYKKGEFKAGEVAKVVTELETIVK